jgi:hypothetical protein
LILLLVPRKELPAASTMNLIDSHVATIGGPAVAGFLIGWFGVGSAYFVDSISFGAVIFSVLAMHARPVLPPAATSGLAQAIEGLRFLVRTPALLGVMLTDFFGAFFGMSYTLMPIFAVDVLHSGPHGLGLLLAAPAVGGVLAAGVLSIVRLPNHAGATILISIGLFGACMVGFGLSTQLWLSLLFLAVAGAFDSISMTLRHAMRNLLSPDALRGRVAAAHRMLSGGGPQLGEFEAGLLASAIGAGPAVAIGGAATVVTAFAAARIVPQIATFRFSRATLEPPEEVAQPAGIESVSAD